MAGSPSSPASTPRTSSSGSPCAASASMCPRLGSSTSTSGSSTSTSRCRSSRPRRRACPPRSSSCSRIRLGTADRWWKTAPRCNNDDGMISSWRREPEIAVLRGDRPAAGGRPASVQIDICGHSFCLLLATSSLCSRRRSCPMRAKVNRRPAGAACVYFSGVWPIAIFSWVMDDACKVFV